MFDDSGGTYGSPRVGIELRVQGWQVSRQHDRAAPDLVKRVFTAPAPDVAWCGDMTEIVTGEGKLYL